MSNVASGVYGSTAFINNYYCHGDVAAGAVPEADCASHDKDDCVEEVVVSDCSTVSIMIVPPCRRF